MPATITKIRDLLTNFEMTSQIDQPLFTTSPDWNVQEEVLLVEAIDMKGLGNWNSIGKYVGSKSAQECADHYRQLYLESPTAPLPPMSVVRKSMNEPQTEAAETPVEGPVPEPDVAARTPIPPVAGLDMLQPRPADAPPPQSQIPGVEISGYMARRNDFDVEHENDAELLLADMEFREGEHATETELKLKVLEIYNSKLDEREERKRFVLERGLLEYKKQRSRPREVREIYNQLRPFARFHSAEEHEALVGGLIREQQLRERIEKLQYYRERGIRTLAEADEYERANDQRQRDLKLQRHREGASHLYGDGMGISPSSRSQRSVRSQRYQARRRGDKRKAAPAASEKGAEDVVGEIGSDVKQAGEGLSLDQQRQETQEQPLQESQQQSQDESRQQPLAPAEAMGDAALVQSAPGGSSLTEEERQLCAHLQLLPRHFEMIKAALVQSARERGVLRRSDAEGVVERVHAEAAPAVFDYCISMGWIPTVDPEEGGNAQPPSGTDASILSGGADQERADGRPTSDQNRREQSRERSQDKAASGRSGD